MLHAAEPSGSDQRNAPRVALLMRPAKLIMASGEFLCVVRDLSETGIRVRLLHPLAIERRLAVEFQTGTNVEMETMWQRESDVGFRFDLPLDVAKEIESVGDRPKRAIRLNLRVPLILSAGGHCMNSTLHNLSNHGARIECGARRLAIGELIQIESLGLPSVRGRVRWRRQDTYGFVFVDTFSLSDLAKYTAALQLDDPARSRVPPLDASASETATG